MLRACSQRLTQATREDAECLNRVLWRYETAARAASDCRPVFVHKDEPSRRLRRQIGLD